jgi:hypothetical protein
MAVRAYAHPYAQVDRLTVEGWEDGHLARAPLQMLYHIAADLDDEARTVERDVETLWYGMQVREKLIALLESLGLYPDQLAAEKEEQRIDRSNWGLGCRMLTEYEAQQARLQWAITRRDPRRWSTDAC